MPIHILPTDLHISLLVLAGSAVSFSDPSFHFGELPSDSPDPECGPP
jgi:hypothetical protein